MPKFSTANKYGTKKKKSNTSNNENSNIMYGCYYINIYAFTHYYYLQKIINNHNKCTEKFCLFAYCLQIVISIIM